MHPAAATIVLLLAIAIAPGLAVGSSSSTTPLINTTCAAVSKGSLYLSYDYCVGVLSADPAGASATDTRGLAIVAANATAHNVTTTLLVLTDLVKHLSDCIGYYKDMGDLVASALDDLRAGRRVSAVDKLSKASGVPMGGCDILLFEGSAKKNPISEENDQNDLVSKLATQLAEKLPNSVGNQRS